MDNPIYRTIHEVIHNPNHAGIWIEQTYHPVKVASNGCRYIDYGKIRFMEQNKEKKDAGGNYTKTAQRARNGEKITWGMQSAPWICIEN